MSSTGGKIEIIENVKNKAAEISLAFNAYLALMVFIILIIVIVMLYKFNKQFNTKVSETFSKLTNRQLIMANAQVSGTPYRFAPRSDRIGTYWNKLHPEGDIVRKTLQIYANQYIKQIPNGDIAVINEKIGNYLANKEVKEVINTETKKVEDIVVTEPKSNKIDPKITVTENGELVAKEVILDPATHQVAAEPGETIAKIEESQPVSESVESSSTQSVQTPTGQPAPEAPPKYETPEGMTEGQEQAPAEQNFDTSEVDTIEKQADGTAPLTTDQPVTTTESWAPSRGLNRKAFDHLNWKDAHRPKTEEPETMSKVTVPEAFGVKKLFNRRGKK